jgi:hypothetical protein
MFWMPDQVRHDEFGLFTRLSNFIAVIIETQNPPRAKFRYSMAVYTPPPSGISAKKEGEK